MTIGDSHSLVDGASRGDPVAIDTLLERHLSSLRAFVRLRAGPVVRNRESQSDLVQSVCREVLGSLENFRYEGEAAFKRWLFTTALRKVVQKDRYWRAEKRDFAKEAAVGDELGISQVYTHAFTASRALAAKEEADRIERAFERLPDHYREVLSLARVAGLPHEEIAVATGRSVESCRTVLRRARVKLAEILTEGSESDQSGTPGSV